MSTKQFSRAKQDSEVDLSTTCIFRETNLNAVDTRLSLKVLATRQAFELFVEGGLELQKNENE